MTTTTITWAWGTNTEILFNPSEDVLDFGWFQAGQFTVAEVDGSVVITIPSNNQTYTLTGIGLADLSMDNIQALDDSAVSAWDGILNADGEDGPVVEDPVIEDPVVDEPTDEEPVVDDPIDETPDTAYAEPWNAETVYLGGDRASVGNMVYEANWWTQSTDPSDNSGDAGTGQPWTFVGYLDTTPVVPDAPEDVHALNITETTALLIWDAAEVPGFGTVSSYEIYQDGELVGSTTSTSYKIEGLTAESEYDFTIVAISEAGSSLPSETHHITTDPLGSDQDDDQEFSPYVDMSLTSSQNLVEMVDEAGLSAVTLAFLLSSGEDQIGWGGFGSIENDTLSNGDTISNIVDQLHLRGVDVSISFGGANGQEPALTFSSAEALAEAYQSVIDKYHVNHLDFDIEGGAIANTAANDLRNQALVILQENNPDLEISFTLPVLPTGLTLDGVNLLSAAQAAGVDIDVVNIMAMDYGENADSGDMGQDAIDAAESTLDQIHAIGLDAQVGITPMIGINDVQSEVFTLEDAQQLVDYADGNEDIAYLSMWSLSRDNGDTVSVVSPIGSGVEQDDYDFSEILNTV